jgi:hypothetical protein
MEVEYRKSIALVLGAVMALAAVIYAHIEWIPFGEYPGEEFFDLAAQTIPILLVALAVEAQARQFDREQMGRLLRAAAVILLAVGESAAVAVSAGLVHPDINTVASRVLVIVTVIGLLGGFLAVIAVALSKSSQQRLDNCSDLATVTERKALGQSSKTPCASRHHRKIQPAILALGVLVSSALASAFIRNHARD